MRRLSVGSVYISRIHSDNLRKHFADSAKHVNAAADADDEEGTHKLCIYIYVFVSLFVCLCVCVVAGVCVCQAHTRPTGVQPWQPRCLCMPSMSRVFRKLHAWRGVQRDHPRVTPHTPERANDMPATLCGFSVGGICVYCVHLLLC